MITLFCCMATTSWHKSKIYLTYSGQRPDWQTSLISMKPHLPHKLNNLVFLASLSYAWLTAAQYQCRRLGLYRPLYCLKRFKLQKKQMLRQLNWHQTDHPKIKIFSAFLKRHKAIISCLFSLHHKIQTRRKHVNWISTEGFQPSQNSQCKIA